MSSIENVMSELESIGVIGDGKVVLLKPAPAPAKPAETPPPAEEAPARPRLSREELSALTGKALQRLEAVIEAVQDLQTVFQELHEAASQGDNDEALQEEA